MVHLIEEKLHFKQLEKTDELLNSITRNSYKLINYNLNSTKFKSVPNSFFRKGAQTYPAGLAAHPSL